jgi:hypothetical protein
MSGLNRSWGRREGMVFDTATALGAMTGARYIESLKDGAQPLPEAGAERTLEAVGCSALILMEASSFWHTAVHPVS